MKVVKSGDVVLFSGCLWMFVDFWPNLVLSFIFESEFGTGDVNIAGSIDTMCLLSAQKVYTNCADGTAKKDFTKFICLKCLRLRKVGILLSGESF